MCLLLLAFLAAAAVPAFLEHPTNQTVVEGGDATLSCNATVNGARQPLNYRMGDGAGSTLQTVGANITDLSLVDGVVGACLLHGRVQHTADTEGSDETGGRLHRHVRCTGWNLLY